MIADGDKIYKKQATILRSRVSKLFLQGGQGEMILGIAEHVFTVPAIIGHCRD